MQVDGVDDLQLNRACCVPLTLAGRLALCDPRETVGPDSDSGDEWMSGSDGRMAHNS